MIRWPTAERTFSGPALPAVEGRGAIPVVRTVLGLIVVLSMGLAESAESSPTLVADLGASQELESVREWPTSLIATATLRHEVYFHHDDGVHGVELWATDGSAAGTRLVVDLCPGRCSSRILPGQIVVFDGRLYFGADDGVRGIELWSSDGTAGGTSLVADLHRPVGRDFRDLFGSPWSLTPFGDVLLFVAPVGDGSESVLWSLSREGDLRELASFPRPGSEQPGHLTLLGDRVVFAGFRPETGRELWITDGTPEGTRLLADLRPGAESGLSQSFEALRALRWHSAEDRVLFRADDGAHGEEPWVTDGTEAGTRLLADLEPGRGGSEPADFFQLEESVLFVAQTAATGREIWAWPADGSSPPEVLEPLSPGAGGSSPMFLDRISAGLFFSASPHSSRNLFLTDGSSEGTRRVAEIDPESWWGADGSSRGANHFVENDRLVFLAREETTGWEYWSSDGTSEGTGILADLTPGPGGSFPAFYGYFLREYVLPGSLPDGRHVLFASDPVHGWEPRRTDGGATGIELVADVDDESSVASCRGSGSCTQLVAGEGFLAFPGIEWPEGVRTLAVSDGSETGSDLVDPAGLDGEWVFRFPGFGLDLATWFQGRFYFAAGVDFSDDELWVSDGTPGGTLPVRQLIPELPRAQPETVHSQDGRLLIAFEDSLGGGVVDFSLWRLSAGGTTAENLGPFGVARVPDFANAPVETLLLVDLEAEGTSLWELPPSTAASPSAVAHLSLERSSVVAERDRLELFLVESPASGDRWPARLWFWARDRETLVLLHGVIDAPASPHFTWPKVPAAFAGRRLVFVAREEDSGAEPWATDGTAEGTTLLNDIFPGTPSAAVSDLTVLGDEVFFVATAPATGREIWRTDGTPSGTRLAIDLLPGPESSRPSDLTVLDGTLYFAAWTPATGVEPWRWEPRRADRPPVVVDVNPGPGSSSPVQLTVFREDLFFLANDGEHGLELHRLGLDRIFADGFESGSLSAW